MDEEKTSYTQDEVNEILKRALAQDAERERALSHEELVEIATEVGIDRDALDRAMAELAQENMLTLALQDEAAEMAAERRVQLKRFGATLLSHAALNGFLYFICQRITGGTWYTWPLLVSGVILTLQLKHVVFPYDMVLRRRREAEKRRERERKRAERDEWKQRIFGTKTRPAETARAFETVVQTGVSALLTLAQRKLAGNKERKDASPGERRR